MKINVLLIKSADEDFVTFFVDNLVRICLVCSSSTFHNRGASIFYERNSKHISLIKKYSGFKASLMNTYKSFKSIKNNLGNFTFKDFKIIACSRIFNRLLL